MLYEILALIRPIEAKSFKELVAAIDRGELRPPSSRSKASSRVPAELDAVTRRVMQLEIEEAALKKEKDRASKKRLEGLQKELQEELKAVCDDI